MRATTSTSSATTPSYSPSVPLTVYRDLASELQSVRANLNSLSAQNQKLVQENEVLRQEINRAVESILRLQKLVDSQSKVSYYQVPPPSSHEPIPQVKKQVTQPSPKKQVFHPRPLAVTNEVEIELPTPQTVYVEEQEPGYYLQDEESEPSQLKSWWFILAILFIIVMGFGAGYLIVRPLLGQHTR
jgi:regulator of replication initiation timing